ncbi:murein L,D-transpeptidase [Flavobacterium sp.]|uniref:murein L,D-transpeptidase n=1 Tax=Flavobacterium sp. TaxID=239 RepID=UPI0037BF0E3E
MNTHNNLLIDFYRKNNFELVWNSKSDRDILIQEIANSENEGLEPKDYNLEALLNFEGKRETLSDSLIINYDIALTLSAQKLISHLSKGKLNPKKLYRNWDLDDKNISENLLLNDGLKSGNLKATLENCKPNHWVYKKLKSCLKLLKKYPVEKTIGLINLKEKIVPNTKNSYIPIIKKRLNYWGDLKEKDTILSTFYNTKTQEAVKLFQARHGLKPDAIIGKSTIEALNFSRNQRIEQVIANLERWRWYSQNLGENYLLINIPNYSIVAVKNNDTILTQKIVVGRETRMTPILDSKLSNINLNPNWTVPPTILREDIYPEATKNHNIFKKKGLLIIDRNNEEINPKDWKINEAYLYKYVQKPSRNNSLGSMKINFPNRFSVYLHDTNHRDYFDYTFRSLSSGCVRLEKPLEMATYILNDSLKWPLQKIKDTTDIVYYNKLQRKKQLEINIKNSKLLAKNPLLKIDTKPLQKPELKTIVVKIKEPIYLHLWYWTAWENKGILQFREDIYCLDADLYSKLKN